MTQAVTYRDAASWAGALNAPEHLSALAALGEQDLPRIAELERWANGVPAGELDEARALHRAWLDDPTRAAELFRVSLQIGGELPPAERLRLFADAASACRDPVHRTALAANAASTAARVGDLNEARRWLAECSPTSDSLVADSALRIAAATVAISEGRAQEAIALLGPEDGAVPILRSYRRLATALRGQALYASGDRAGGDRAFDALIASAGEQEAATIVARLPPSWDVDTSRFDRPWRAEEASSGRWRIAGGVFCVLAAIGHGIAAGMALSGGDPGDAWFVLLLGCPFLLVLASWLAFTGVRHLRIARAGLAGTGQVVSKTYVSRSRKGRPRYVLGVQASLRDQNGHAHHVAATSLSSCGPETAERYQGRTLRVLWHPAYPRFILIRDPIRTSV